MLEQQLKNIILSLLLSSPDALSINRLNKIINDDNSDNNKKNKEQLKNALDNLLDQSQTQIWALNETATGYKIIIKPEYNKYIAKMLIEKPPTYSPALLETLSIIAYKQPATRADIEKVRGVATSSNIMKTLRERGWIKINGYKDVPGKPSLWGTTDEFLNYFNLKSLSQLPKIDNEKIKELAL
ncbi:MAG: SMC-Scp complex subunit ScpB [Gammaproteobacteria bacterium]|nr:MAG: SMC-Scp complex subunit ScpB [Gammaproteobacteria bacterium]